MIDIVGVTQHYGVRPVLRNVSLRINRGELVALTLGPTLRNWQLTGLYHITGFTAVPAGTVRAARRSAGADEA